MTEAEGDYICAMVLKVVQHVLYEADKLPRVPDCAD